jgi:Bacterial Ig domain
MLAHSGPRLWCASLAAGFAMLVFAQAASAAAPVCDTALRQVSIPAGASHENPKAPCEDADGDAITIQTVAGPSHGTLSPAGDVSINDPQTYTAAADAAGMTDTMTFRATANGEQSADFSIEVQIGDADQAPVCDSTTGTVQSGKSVAIALSCEDPEGNGFTIHTDGPAHGTYDGAVYKPNAGYTGTDTITFWATDEWDATSDDATATITVTTPPQPPPTKPKPKPKPPVKTQPSPPADHTAPSLDLLAASPLASRPALRRGIVFMATTNEAGRMAVQVFVGRNTARRYRINRHATARVLVGSLTRDVAKGDNAVTLKLSRKARRRLRKAPSVQLKVIVRIADAAGNVRTKRLRITLERT